MQQKLHFRRVHHRTQGSPHPRQGLQYLPKTGRTSACLILPLSYLLKRFASWQVYSRREDFLFALSACLWDAGSVLGWATEKTVPQRVCEVEVSHTERRAEKTSDHCPSPAAPEAGVPLHDQGAIIPALASELWLRDCAPGERGSR